MSSPKVSVIIPSYNTAAYIGQALDSVLNQTYDNYEIIVVDDGSTDNTYEIIQNYRPLITYHYQENQGLPGARNTGIRIATGEYISLLDADDVFLPHHLENSVKYLEAHKNLGFIFADVIFFNNDTILKESGFENTKIYDIPYDQYSDNFRIFTRRIFRELIYGSFIANCTAVIKKRILYYVGLYDASLIHAEDRDLWLRIDEKYKIGYINDKNAKVRVHEKNFLRTKINKNVLKYRLRSLYKAKSTLVGLNNLDLISLYDSFSKNYYELYYNNKSFKNCIMPSYYFVMYKFFRYKHNRLKSKS